MLNTRIVYTACCCLFFFSSFAVANVYLWKNQSGVINYSDVPPNMVSERVFTMNVRARTINSPSSPSLPESGSILKSDIAGKQKVIKSKKYGDESKCETVRSNLELALKSYSVTVINREDFILRSQNYINEYCK